MRYYNRQHLRRGERLRYGYYQILDHFFGRDRVFRWHNKSRRKLYQKAHERLKASGHVGKLIPIERRTDLTLKELKRDYIRKGIPVVWEGAAKDWPCVKEWSLDYFKDRYGHEEIVMVDHEAIESDFERLTLGDVINEIREETGRYYRFYPLIQRHPEHIKDFDYEWLLKARTRGTMDDEFEVFIGGKNTHTPLHNAFSANLFTQVYGEKEWVLYHPNYTMIQDPDPVENVYRSASSRQGGIFNPFKEDFSKHPLYKYIDGVKVHLKPGDVLFNPPYWWHCVTNPTDSIGVGYRWFAPAYVWRQSPLYFSLDLCATNPSIWKSLKLIKTDTNLIQLAQTGRLEAFLEAEKKKENSPYKQT